MVYYRYQEFKNDPYWKINANNSERIRAIPWGLIQGRCGPVSDFIFDALSGKNVCILVGFEVFSSHIPTVADI